MAKSRARQCAVGVDYGTNSVRALVVDVADGADVGTCVYNYPSGQHGILLDPKDPTLARQHPGDYIEGFYRSVRGALKAAQRHSGVQAEQIIGIGIDTTGSTPIPVDRSGMPPAPDRKFAKNLAAQPW